MIAKKNLFNLYNGIIPFYEFPHDVNVDKGLKSFVPLAEFIIGYLFNLLVIGIVISYSLSKLAERNIDNRTKKKDK